MGFWGGVWKDITHWQGPGYVLTGGKWHLGHYLENWQFGKHEAFGFLTLQVKETDPETGKEVIVPPLVLLGSGSSSATKRKVLSKTGSTAWNVIKAPFEAMDQIVKVILIVIIAIIGIMIFSAVMSARNIAGA